jgi:hypothetical protein
MCDWDVQQPYAVAKEKVRYAAERSLQDNVSFVLVSVIPIPDNKCQYMLYDMTRFGTRRYINKVFIKKRFGSALNLQTCRRLEALQTAIASVLYVINLRTNYDTIAMPKTFFDNMHKVMDAPKSEYDRICNVGNVEASDWDAHSVYMISKDKVSFFLASATNCQYQLYNMTHLGTRDYSDVVLNAPAFALALDWKAARRLEALQTAIAAVLYAMASRDSSASDTFLSDMHEVMDGPKSAYADFCKHLMNEAAA